MWKHIDVQDKRLCDNKLSYYSNPDNDGNLGLALYNTSDNKVTLEAGERVCQGIFKKYLVADNDVTLSTERLGGIGSTGNK